MKETTQANLPKPGKGNKEKNTIQLSGIRPITVMHTLWRNYGSSYARGKEVKRYMKGIGEDLSESAEVTASQVFGWHRGAYKFASAQDFSSAYDVMNSFTSTALSKATGWPEGSLAIKSSW